MKEIISVGFDFPGNVVERVDYKDPISLADADIICFAPNFDDYHFDELYKGLRTLSKSYGPKPRNHFAHWRTEILEATKSGKTVFIFLDVPETVWYYTGDQRHSGTGKNARTTDVVDAISNYSAIPLNLKDIQTKSGSKMKLVGQKELLTEYWNAFEEYSVYKASLPVEEALVGGKVISDKDNRQILGSIVRSKSGGHLVLLPMLNLDDLDYSESELTPEQFGKVLMSSLVHIDKSLKRQDKTVPPPEWCNSEIFDSPKCRALRAKISEIESTMREQQNQKVSLEAQLADSQDLKLLLYGQGKPLENAVLRCLKLMGFDAEPFEDSESEFDVVFRSAEGRFLGEVEGKDNNAINVDKFSQLERNINEDFAKPETSEHAKGVLFGNGYRLKPLDKRPCQFTQKCLSGADRTGYALVETSSLFSVASYLESNSNPEFAAACRKSILETCGQIVTFPSTPMKQEVEK